MAPRPSTPRARFFVPSPLSASAGIELTGNPAHHLLHVLRAKVGDKVLLFNGSDGEWLARLTDAGKKTAFLRPEHAVRAQAQETDIWLVCAPLKAGRSEWVVEKAAELGASQICPVRTEFTATDRVNEAKWASIALEASQQCERLTLPMIAPFQPLERMLNQWPSHRHLVFGDESGAAGNAKDVLPGVKSEGYAVLIGPEGGFSEGELVLLRSLPYVSGICMGPRILRADTAAVAALALMQAFCGDWEGKPAFRRTE